MRKQKNSINDVFTSELMDLVYPQVIDVLSLDMKESFYYKLNRPEKKVELIGCSPLHQKLKKKGLGILKEQTIVFFLFEANQYSFNYSKDLKMAWEAMLKTIKAEVELSLFINPDAGLLYTPRDIQKMSQKKIKEVNKERECINQIFKKLKPIMDGSITIEEAMEKEGVIA